MSELNTLLMVEDDDDHAELISLGLGEQSGICAVHRVPDGEAALAFLRREGAYKDTPRPNVILLDLRVPKVSGLEVLRIVKSSPELQTIPVVVLTTSAAQPDLAEAYANHVNSFVVKPQDFDQFRRLIQDVQYYWGVWNRSPAPSRR